jgi:hypothetical protein
MQFRLTGVLHGGTFKLVVAADEIAIDRDEAFLAVAELLGFKPKDVPVYRPYHLSDDDAKRLDHSRRVWFALRFLDAHIGSIIDAGELDAAFMRISAGDVAESVPSRPAAA